MTMRQEISERIDHMTETTLERLKNVIDTDPTFKYPNLPDVRVQRTPEEIERFRDNLKALAEPTGEDLTAFNKAVKRRPLGHRLVCRPSRNGIRFLHQPTPK